ncbi:MFS transporter [Bacillus cereus]|uniref:MFS transporter n=1 Tax=Bacillus cereus TaxID=1396 RepID=UPI001D0D152B|nr:MFS transporter [Bacillus cereus]
MVRTSWSGSLVNTNKVDKYVLWRDKNFLLLLFGQNLSAFGDWFRTVATIGLIYKLTGDATHISLLFICSILPTIVISMVFSPIIDRFSRRLLMIIADIARLCIGIGFVIVVSTNVSPYFLYLLLIINGSFSGLYLPARSSFIPEVIPQQSLTRANSILTTSFSAVMLISTGVGGLVTEILSIKMIYFIDAFTFLISAVCLMFIKISEKIESSKVKDSYFKQVSEGLLEIKNMPVLKSAIWVLVAREFALGIVYVIFSLYILEFFNAGNFGLGLGHMASGLGQIIGGATLVAFFKKKEFTLAYYRKWITLALLILGGLHCLSYQQDNFILFLIVVVLANLWYGPIEVLSSTSIMTYVNPEVRGRVFASSIALSRISYILAFILMMFIGDLVSIPTIAFGIGGFIIIASLINNKILSRTRFENEQQRSEVTSTS